MIWPIRLSARTPGFHPGKRGSIPLWATHQFWPIRLSARTPGFHPGKRGSIPLWATHHDHSFEWSFFFASTRSARLISYFRAINIYHGTIPQSTLTHT